MEIPKPSAIRNYLYEYVLIALVLATSTMFYMWVDLNKYVRTDMLQMNNQEQQTIRDNTNVMQQFMNYERFNKPIDETQKKN